MRYKNPFIGIVETLEKKAGLTLDNEAVKLFNKPELTGKELKIISSRIKGEIIRQYSLSQKQNISYSGLSGTGKIIKNTPLMPTIQEKGALLTIQKEINFNDFIGNEPKLEISRKNL